MYLSRNNSDASRSTSATTIEDSSSTASTTIATNSITPPKEPTVSQRVTRSSQRFAKENGDNNECKNSGSAENDGEDINTSANSQADKSAQDQSGRKAKRKKLEQLEMDQEPNPQEPTFIPEFCPDDYQPPESNSIELYRRIVKKHRKEVMGSTCIQSSKAPCGYKDYLLFNGPYLLDEDKLGVGLSGASVDRSSLSQLDLHQPQLPRLKMKFSKTHSGAFKLLSSPQHQMLCNQRLGSYHTPEHLPAPESLKVDSPLYELFQTQEKARHKMRLQHLKERERSILATEQEILRAYNRDYNMSACNYINHQERYHYIHERNGLTECLDYPTASREIAVISQNSSTTISNNDEDEDKSSVVCSTTAEQKVIIKLKEDLQQLDDKWTVVKKEMFTRHKNESDTLHAIQSLEWEWRAKETGACDKEYVPRVEVSIDEY